VNLMRERKIAAFFANVVLVWPTSPELGGLLSVSTSSSLIGVQLAQRGGEAVGYTDGPIGDSAGGPVTIDGGSAELKDSAGYAPEISGRFLLVCRSATTGALRESRGFQTATLLK
jgi:hypothetical protein